MMGTRQTVVNDMMSKLKIALPGLVLAGLLAGAVGSALTIPAAMAGKDDTTRYERISSQLTQRGVGALEKNQLDAARQLWEEAIVANPSNATAYSYLGLAAQRGGDKENAKKYFELALVIDPNEVHALSWGGQTDLSDADLDGAQAKLQRLARVCGQGCAEYKLLSDSVVSYKSKTAPN
jgi:tetratricopeptide (TPR) repeat protein